MPADSKISGLLKKASAGERHALDELIPLVYAELQLLAHQRVAAERSDHTLNTTGLVHETYMRLLDLHEVDLCDRTHFLALASRVMRRVLVDYARKRGAAKRGGGWVKVEFQDDLQLVEPHADAIEELDSALNRLEEVSPRRSQLLEQRYFGGLKLEECAEALGISIPTVTRELRSARAWLAREFSQQAAG
jgi:RNA polymerase sigma factor (TIGR02999 family)